MSLTIERAQCPVCQEPFTSSQALVAPSQCGHVFCSTCANTHFTPTVTGTGTDLGPTRKRKKCPVCRAVVSQRDLKHIFVSFGDFRVLDASFDFGDGPSAIGANSRTGRTSKRDRDVAGGVTTASPQLRSETTQIVATASIPKDSDQASSGSTSNANQDRSPQFQAQENQDPVQAALVQAQDLSPQPAIDVSREECLRCAQVADQLVELSSERFTEAQPQPQPAALQGERVFATCGRFLQTVGGAMDGVNPVDALLKKALEGLGKGLVAFRKKYIQLHQAKQDNEERITNLNVLLRRANESVQALQQRASAQDRELEVFKTSMLKYKKKYYAQRQAKKPQSSDEEDDSLYVEGPPTSSQTSSSSQLIPVPALASRNSLARRVGHKQLSGGNKGVRPKPP